MTSAAGVMASTAKTHKAGPGSSPRAALHDLKVAPISQKQAREVIAHGHYLGTYPGGTMLSFGVFSGSRLSGALTLGAGPAQAHRMVEGARSGDCLALTRFWLSEELPQYSESRVLGMALRSLRRHTSIKFLVTYADPAQGHVGTIYQATNWIYTGLSQAMPLYDIGDGNLRHSRSLSYSYGTHSVRHFKKMGVPIVVVPQGSKHRYLYFLDRKWRSRMKPPALPYPKGGEKRCG